jgi:hypothetical protein
MMSNPNRYLRLIAGVFLFSAIAFTPAAQAGTCSFGVPLGGSLAKSASGDSVEGSAGLTGFNIGTAGKVTITCSNGGILTTSAPNLVSIPPNFNEARAQALVQRGNSTAPTDFTTTRRGVVTPYPAPWDKSAAPMSIPPGTSTLNIAITAGTIPGGTITSGFYSYGVQLSVIPN